MPKRSGERWNGIIILFHWTLAILIAFMFVLGWMVDLVREQAGSRQVMSLHLHFGLILFALMSARLVWRLITAAPVAASGRTRVLRRVAATVQWALYASVLSVAVAGYSYMAHTPRPMTVLWLINLPKFRYSEAAIAPVAYAHLYLGWALLGLIAIHVSAALWHQFVHRDETLLRMLPQWRPRSKPV